jgi:outer membrane protein TolC
MDLIEEQERAYYESLEKDMEKDIIKQIEKIDRETKRVQLQKDEEIEKQRQYDLEIERKKELERTIKELENENVE